MDIELIICAVVGVAALIGGIVVFGGQVQAGGEIYRNLIDGSDNDD